MYRTKLYMSSWALFSRRYRELWGEGDGALFCWIGKTHHLTWYTELALSDGKIKLYMTRILQLHLTMETDLHLAMKTELYLLRIVKLREENMELYSTGARVLYHVKDIGL